MATQTTNDINKSGYFIIDAIMISLLAVNLMWIVFDWLFEYELIRSFLYGLLPGFTDYYETTVHPRFILIDLLFISVFLLEFFIRWGIAIYHRVYHRWFFFPFIHFYDLLGCIPVGGFRFLRLLRIVSVIFRLHKHGIINLAETAPGVFLAKYYRVLIEELTDRVTLNILTDMQKEIRNGGPVMDRIINEVIIPHKSTLVEWMSNRVEKVSADNYEQYHEDIQMYVEEKINKAVEDNDAFARLEHIPFLGTVARRTIEEAISDIVFHVINAIMQDLASSRNKVLINEIADVFFDAILLKEENPVLNTLVIQTMEQSIEIMKQNVQVQKWKIRDLAEDNEDYINKLSEEMARFSKM